MMALGCIKARMGDLEYYVVTMRAGQLIDSVGFASEMPEWEDMTADEKMQREPDINRVVNEIVPYIVEDKDRFFGSFIVDIYSGYDDLVYEPISDIVKNLQATLRFPMKDMGVLTFPGKERLIALDGQHRLLGLRIAIRGAAGLLAGTKISPSWKLDPHPELSQEEVCVIFVKHENTKKIRKIFNKVNKYARQTSRGDNIITSDDDIFAVISRRLFDENEPLASINGIDLVNWKSNTLSQRSKQLTTVSALYTMSETILKDEKFSTMLIPDEDAVESAYVEVKSFWQESLEGIDTFKRYMELTNLDSPVSVLRETSLLMKPVTQMALAHVAYMAKTKGIAWKDVIVNLNKVDWSFENKLWFNILVIGSANKKMITGKEAIRQAGMVISYLVMGRYMSRDEVEAVHDIICNARDNEMEPLPQMV